MDEMLVKGWICESSSSYAHPFLFEKKKMADMHICIDYRCLNAKNKVDRFPLPLIDDIMDLLGYLTVYTILGLKSAYH